MSRSHEFTLVDVFAEDRWSGNQLAVVHDAADLTDAEMLAVACEFGFSETTFVLSTSPGDDGAWPVRIFTPGGEVPFAGHPTLGTAWVLRHRIAEDRSLCGRITLDLPAGRIPVEPESDGVLWMTQLEPRFSEPLDRALAAVALGCDPAALAPDLPVQSVSTGLPFAVVPMRGLADVRALSPRGLDPEALARLCPTDAAPAVLVFTPESREPGNDLHVRVFVPSLGVPEDPATGSANGCLAGYLSRHRVLGSAEVEARAEQGWEIGRPSLLRLRARPRGDGILVRVGGRVRRVAVGRLD